MTENPYENSETPGHVTATRGCLSVWGVVAFAVVALVAIVVVMLLPMFARNRVIGQRYQCTQNLKRLVTAMHAYHDDHGHFPPAFTTDENGKRLHSWRTLLLPYLGQKSLHTAIDLKKPWDDPVNTMAHQTMIATFACPAAELPPGFTTYKGMVGPKAFFADDGAPRTTKDMPTSKTLAIIEVAPERACHWMDPNHEDSIDFLTKMSKSTETSHSNVPAVHADGSGLSIAKNADADDLQELFDIGHSD